LEHLSAPEGETKGRWRMSVFPNLRRWAVVLAIGGTLFVLGKTLLFPVPLDPLPVASEFPSASPLPDWQAVRSEPDPLIPNTVRFQSTHGNQAIDLEMQFIPDLPTHYIRNPLLALRFLPRGHLPLDAAMQFYVNSRSRVIANLQTDTPSEALVDAREPSPRSGYGIWAAKQRLHLSAVVTPAGATSMDTRRTFRSLYVDNVDLSRIGKWLLGRAKLPDRRCVLIHFSIPEPPPAGRGEGVRMLESAWARWQQAYRPNFPE
jgi:cyanosortase A-associated protein